MSTDIPLPLTSASTPKLIQLQLYLRYSTFSLTNCISNFLPLHSILILFSEYENKCILQSSYNMCISRPVLIFPSTSFIKYFIEITYEIQILFLKCGFCLSKFMKFFPPAFHFAREFLYLM